MELNDIYPKSALGCYIIYMLLTWFPQFILSTTLTPSISFYSYHLLSRPNQKLANISEFMNVKIEVAPFLPSPTSGKTILY